MLSVMNHSEAEEAISKAINTLEVEGIVDETLLINTKNVKGKVLLEVGRKIEENRDLNNPSYKGIQSLNYSDNLVILANKFLSLKEKQKIKKAV